jgi:hypothetical protein
MNTQPQFKPGDEVFSVDGRAAYYVARGHWGHIVEPIHEDDDGEPQVRDAETWREVFAKPTRERIDAEIREIEEHRESARRELRQLRDEVAQAKAERTAALKVLASHPSLTPVIEYLEGRLTHAAVFDYSSIWIKPLADAVAPEDASDRRNGYVRLLALYGGLTAPGKQTPYNDDLRWTLNRYHDGSGNDSKVCILGTSEENVRERLQAYLDREFPKRGVHGDHTLMRWAASARRLGLRVPDELVKKVVDQEAQAEANRQKHERDRLAQIEKEAEALRLKLGSAA